jgi:hypothetical protein
MCRLLSYLSLIYFTILGCNGSVKPTLADAEETLRKEDEGARKLYSESYQSALHLNSDSALQRMFLKLDSLIHVSAHYMDSISNEMSFLVNHDPTNTNYPKILFLYKGVGDTIFALLTGVNNYAGAIALRTGHKATVDSLRLTVLNQPTADAWKIQDFSVLDPFTAMALLHDFTFEIFQLGIACLPEK